MEEDVEGPAALLSSDTFRVTLKTNAAVNDFAVGVNCSVRQLKGCVAERLGIAAEQLVLIHAGHILSGSALLRDHAADDGTVSLYMFISPPGLSSPTVQAVETDDRNYGDLTPSPTSPLCLVEELGSVGPPLGAAALFPPLQSQMRRQLLSDPELMGGLLGGPLVRGALAAASPQLTRQLLLSDPLTLQLLQSHPEAAAMLDDPDVMAQMLELTHNPNLIQEVMRNQNLANREPAPGDSRQRTNMNEQERPLKTRGDPPVTPASGGESQPIRARERPSYSRPTEPLSSMQSLLEHICACPGLMESLLSGPYVNTILDSLSQNKDLAAQMLLSHPLFSGNPQLQQQIREQLPLFLQQMQSPELLAAMLNPRALEALLQIQQGLQTLASEAPVLVPSADLESVGVNPADADADPPGNDPQVAMVTEQQQMQFVQQMLQMLANTNQQSQE